MGVGANDQRFHWALNTPGRGMEHGLISGPPRSGRTNNLRVILVEATQAPHFVVMIADPLDRNGLCDTFSRIAATTARNFGETVDRRSRHSSPARRDTASAASPPPVARSRVAG